MLNYLFKLHFKHFPPGENVSLLISWGSLSSWLKGWEAIKKKHIFEKDTSSLHYVYIMVANQVQKALHGRNKEEKIVVMNWVENAVELWQRVFFKLWEMSLLRRLNLERNPERREMPGHITFLFNQCKWYCTEPHWSLFTAYALSCWDMAVDSSYLKFPLPKSC